MVKPVLVVGARGAFGRAVAEAFARAGHRVRGLVRAPAGPGADLDAIEIVVGDAQDRSTLEHAAQGVGIVVHAVNYPYPMWDPAMREVTAKIVAVARTAGALLIFPGNVYGFGAQTGRALAEDALQNATTRKGRLRVELEFMISRACDDGRMRALVLRAGDFFGPSVRNGLVDRIFARAAAGRTMQVLGRPSMPHQWAYMPDLARLAVELAAREEQLAPCQMVHFAGHVVTRQLDFLRAVAVAAGRPELGIRVLPWWMLRTAALVDPMVREVLELDYLFDDAVILDDPVRRRLVPTFQPTPLATAIAATLGSYRRHQAGG
jgi:nucleoside-diphosphate-sugar epimerase